MGFWLKRHGEPLFCTSVRFIPTAEFTEFFVVILMRASVTALAVLLSAGCMHHASPDAAASIQQEAAILMRFEMQNTTLSSGMLSAATQSATQPNVARLGLEDGETGEVSGLLVFATIDEFAAWRESSMDSFFGNFGEDASFRSVRIIRPANAELSGRSGLSQLADEIRISYQNAENEAAGDADIDAVTVICGDGAECTPSN
ncbi:hypothetical protein [Aurantiacibacter hainanensis]|uniref:hypothetical protein n=1 Tax=Aurantiacibacter hainanensis TaxID=3076114 RepID=UPI0030C6BF16